MKFFSQMNINRHDFLLIDQRMTAFADIDIAFGIKDRPCGVHIHGEGSAGENKVQFYQIFQVIAKVFAFLGSHVTQRSKDDFDLCRLFHFEIADFIVQFYDCHRFDKKSGTGGGLVVDHTRNLSFVFGFDRDTVTSVSHGDHGILQIGSGGTVDHTGKLCMDAFAGHFHRTTDLF